MPTAKVKTGYKLPPEQADYVRQYCKAHGLQQSELIDMLIQLWRQHEAGRVQWTVKPSEYFPGNAPGPEVS